MRFFLLLGTSVLAKIDVAHEKSPLHLTEPKVKESAEPIDHRKVYTEFFKMRRREHQMAIKSIKEIDIDKRRVFLEDVVHNIVNVIVECRGKLDRIQHAATDRFPDDSEAVRDLLSKVIENTAFFSDLSLHFSQWFEKNLAKNKKMKTAVVWAYNYSVVTGLFDEDTLTRVNLMAQQHEIIKRDPLYDNPYDRVRTKDDIEREAYDAMKKRKAEKEKETRKVDKKSTKSEL